MIGVLCCITQYSEQRWKLSAVHREQRAEPQDVLPLGVHRELRALLDERHLQLVLQRRGAHQHARLADGEHVEGQQRRPQRVDEEALAEPLEDEPHGVEPHRLDRADRLEPRDERKQQVFGAQEKRVGEQEGVGCAREAPGPRLRGGVQDELQDGSARGRRGVQEGGALEALGGDERSKGGKRAQDEGGGLLGLLLLDELPQALGSLGARFTFGGCTHG